MSQQYIFTLGTQEQLHIDGLFDGCVDVSVGKTLGLYQHVYIPISENDFHWGNHQSTLATYLHRKGTSQDTMVDNVHI